MAFPIQKRSHTFGPFTVQNGHVRFWRRPKNDTFGSHHLPIDSLPSGPQLSTDRHCSIIDALISIPPWVPSLASPLKVSLLGFLSMDHLVPLPFYWSNLGKPFTPFESPLSSFQKLQPTCMWMSQNSVLAFWTAFSILKPSHTFGPFSIQNDQVRFVGSSGLILDRLEPS